MITGLGKYWKWIQVTDKVGFNVNLYRYPINKEHWEIQYFPALEAWKHTVKATETVPQSVIYGIQLIFIVWAVRVDMEIFH